jgi:hypothetical protein
MTRYSHPSVSLHYLQQQSTPVGSSPPADVDPWAPPLASPEPGPLGSGRWVLVGGSMLTLATLVVAPNLGPLTASSGTADQCLQIDQPQAMLSRQQLQQLLNTPTQTSQTTLQAWLPTPYCRLAPAADAEGVTVDRQAYPLEFDPNTWLVVQYQGDRYQGYDFSLRR